MLIEYYKNSLQEHYSRSVQTIETTNKAAKDVVGESYEVHRSAWISQFDHLDTATSDEADAYNKVACCEYTPDQYIVHARSRKVLAIEEDKGHYVDKCFAKRAIFNASEVFADCMGSGLDPPYFILSSPTNYDIAAILESRSKLFNEQVAALLHSKFKFFPSCDHGRTSRRKYLVDPQMPFEVSHSRVAKEVEFFNNLK